MRNWSIVSPMSPNGVCFLLNILVELDILIYRSFNPNDGPLSKTWNQNGRAFVIKKNEFEDLKKHIHSITDNKKCYFESNLRVHWDHPVQISYYEGFNLIAFLRDPRDALFSWFRRLKRQGSIAENLEFKDFIQSPSQRFPLMFRNIQNQIQEGCELVFTEYWMANMDRIIKNNYGDQIDEHLASYETCLKKFSISGKRNLIVKFEEFKKAPIISTINILNLMEVEKDFSEVVKAIEKSKFEKAFNNDRQINVTPTVNFKGQPFEFISNLQEKEVYALIRERLDGFYQFSGYE